MKKYEYIIAIPSKGRLYEKTMTLFQNAGMEILRHGNGRGYNAKIKNYPNINVLFLSAREIVDALNEGHIHLGITGADLIYEYTIEKKRPKIIQNLNFGHANLVVAVPKIWLDVTSVNDLEEVAVQFREKYGYGIRVATKYTSLTRKFFRKKGIIGYRIVENQGATEAAPAAETAEIIVDITSSGKTLSANHLKIPRDGIILKSSAVLAQNINSENSNPLRQIQEKIKYANQKIVP